MGARYPVGAGRYQAHRMRETRFSLAPLEGYVPLYLRFLTADSTLSPEEQGAHFQPMVDYLRERGADPQVQPNVLFLPKGTSIEQEIFRENWTGGWLLLVAIPDTTQCQNRVMRQAQKHELSGKCVGPNEEQFSRLVAAFTLPIKKKKGGQTLP